MRTSPKRIAAMTAVATPLHVTALRLALMASAAALALLAIPHFAHAQGVVRGAEEGAHHGVRTGSHVAGPVGGAVGGAVGLGVGGVVGGVNGVLGINPHHSYRHRRTHRDI
jgi:hypothetical protein